MTDRALLNLAHGGDMRAANELTVRYLGMARHLANQYVYPGAEREDIVQQALLGLVAGIRTWKPGLGTPVKAYLVICMERMIQTGLSFSRRRKHLMLSHATSLNVVAKREEGGETERIELWSELATGIDPLDALLASEALREVLDQVNALSSLERAVVVGLLVEGKSYRLLANELGRGKKSIDNALQRAKRRIPELAA